jgi:hypothetical protein
MIQRIAICLIIAIGLTVVNAQTTINLRGKVSNKAGNPVSNAIVTLVKQGISDTTGADGMYAIAGGTGVQLPLLMPQNQFISMSNGFVIFSLPAPSPVKVEIFDTKGDLIKREVKQNAITGFYRFKIEENAHASKLLIIKASIGQDQVILRYLPVHNSMYAVRNGAGSGVGVEKNGFVKLAAVNDTLKTTAPNYKTQITAITSYDQLVNITLDTAGGGGVKPSAGCLRSHPEGKIGSTSSVCRTTTIRTRPIGCGSRSTASAVRLRAWPTLRAMSITESGNLRIRPARRGPRYSARPKVWYRLSWVGRPRWVGTTKAVLTSSFSAQ